MRHTPQIKKALQYAARKHHGQFRAEVLPLPYVTHLFSVALLVAEAEQDEDVISAALLHDVLEDTDATRDDIVLRFGERVAGLVEDVTEVKEFQGQPLSWRERKQQYLTHLEAASDDALLIALADKIDNIESKLEAFDDEGESLLGRWSQPVESYLWYHGSVLAIAHRRLPHHILTRRLASVHEREKYTFEKFASS